MSIRSDRRCNFLAFRAASKRLRVRETTCLHTAERFRERHQTRKSDSRECCVSEYVERHLLATEHSLEILWEIKTVYFIGKGVISQYRRKYMRRDINLCNSFL